MDGLSDEALVVAVGDRSREALNEIYRRHGGAVWSVAKRVCRSAELAEEVCKAVFTGLWSGSERFDPSRGVLRTWLVAEAHARAVALAVASDGPEAPSTDVASHVAQLPEDVRRAIDKLAPAEREAILLAYFGGPTYSGEAIKSHIRRGLLNLRRTLAVERVAM